MYYKKIPTDTITIEFNSDWLGEETVIINGQIVSRKSSIMGTHHDFTIVENGQLVNYILTSKLDGNLGVFIDVRKNGIFIKEDIPLSFGGKPKAPENTFKKDGIAKVKRYHMREGIEALQQALAVSPEDPEIYFYMACAYSIEEKTAEGFECLRMAVKNNLNDRKAILSEHMLAYLRMNEAFENFVHSNFTEFDRDKM